MSSQNQVYVQLLFNSTGNHPLQLYDEITNKNLDQNVFGVNCTFYEAQEKLPVKVVRLAACDQFIGNSITDLPNSSYEAKSIVVVDDFNKVDDFVEYAPLNFLYFGFHTSNISSLRMKLEVIVKEFNSENYQHFYECFVTGHQLISSSFSTVVTPLLKKNCDQIFGHLKFEYFVVQPWQDLAKYEKLQGTSLNDLKKPILIGHRGCGNSYGNSPSRYMENTIDSFLRASDGGASFVELDVQLTRDHHVIVYHDFLTEPLTSRENTEDISEHLLDHLDIPIRDLNLSQLKLHRFLHATQPNHNEKVGRSNSTISERKAGCMFPLLCEVMQQLPVDVGINIELKYPQQERDGSWELEGSYFDRNVMAEKVLQVVFEENQIPNRPIIFSSFDPGLCIAMSYKQKLYPVLFLVEEPSGPEHGYLDYRTRAVKTAILFSRAEDLQGIVCSIDSILPIIESVSSEAHRRSLHLFTYGARNCDTEVILTQAHAKVDGIIFDRIYDLLPDLAEKNSGVIHRRNPNDSIS